MTQNETAAPQAAPDLNAPSARPSAEATAEETLRPQRTDPAPDPAAYPDVHPPEDVSFPQGALEEFKTLSAELGLTSEQAQKLLDLEARFVRAGAQHSAEEKRSRVERWAEQTQALYGAQCPEAVSLAVRAADAFGGPELRELLEATGLGNHPVIVRTFSEIGKSISEDVLPGGQPAAPQDKTFAEALYGKHN